MLFTRPRNGFLISTRTIFSRSPPPLSIPKRNPTNHGLDYQKRRPLGFPFSAAEISRSSRPLRGIFFFKFFFSVLFFQPFFLLSNVGLEFYMQKKKICGKKPKFVDKGFKHPYCSRSCARNGQGPSPTACVFRGCRATGKPAFANFCSEAHAR